MRIAFTLMFFLFAFFYGQSQDITPDNVSSYLSKYAIKSLSIKDLNQFTSDRFNWIIPFGDLKDRSATLYENDLISPNYTASTIDKSLSSLNMPITYSGYLTDDPASSIRLTLYNGSLVGYIETVEGKFFIEPLKQTLKSIALEHVMYREKDVSNLMTGLCAASQVHQKSSKIAIQPKDNEKSIGCRTYRIAIAMDYSYVDSNDGIEDAIAQSTAVMNMVAGDFDNAFNEEIRFQIVEHWASTCRFCDPWILSNDAENLLRDFTDWAPTGFNSEHDLGQLWTNRDLFGIELNGDISSGTIGVAWIDGTCNERRYHVLENFSSLSWALRVLTTHEIGHNFAATHDPEETTFIMSPEISNTTSWSGTSRNQINAALTRHNCFSGCINDNCLDVVTITDPVVSENIEARQLILSSGSTNINLNLTLSAPDVELSNFSVDNGVCLSIDNTGCN